MVFVQHFEGYSIDYSKVNKAFKKIEKKYVDNIKEKFSDLVAGAQNIDVTRLQGVNRLFRMRVGIYRIIFEVDERKKILLPLSVNHRKEAYADF